MAKRILVPLDGREETEAVVPLVGALAQGAGSSVRLVRVFPVPESIVGTHGRTVAYVDQEMARLTAEGLEELKPFEDALTGVPVESVVRFGDPVEETLLEAEAVGADLIVLAVPKRGRLLGWLARSSAERIARQAPVSTLLLRA